MVDESRRRFLGVAATMPLAAGDIATRTAQRFMPVGATVGMAAAGEPNSLASRKIVKTFSQLLGLSETRWRREARHIHMIDPDLASMHLPLATVFRMQAKRNYHRIVEENRKSLLEKVARGEAVEVWL